MFLKLLKIDKNKKMRYSELENSKSVMPNGAAFTIAYGVISSSITEKVTIEEEQVCKYMKEQMD